MTKQSLNLQEQFLLLCLNDETGRFEAAWPTFGLNAAALGEMLLGQRITLDKEKVRVMDTTTLGDEVLDTALTCVAMRKRTQKLYWWVFSLYKHHHTAVDVLLARLIRRGVLTEREGRVLWVFPRTEYPTVDGAPEHDLRQAVTDVVAGGKSCDDRMAVLLAILSACGSLRFAVRHPDRAEVRKRRKRVQQIQENCPLASALGKALAQAIAAASSC